MGRRSGSLEGLELRGFWAGRRVLVTGHTGFKGSWLSLWLADLGASVFGLALESDTDPSLFEQMDLTQLVDHRLGDVRDCEVVQRRVAEVQPDVVIHLAAQPLVRRSYREPLLTWQTNVMGTLHVLEAVRALEKRVAVVVVTTDKVYESREWPLAYRESDTLGGYDPYSSSKSAVELGVASWRSSFFEGASGIRVATARAGNVIGGGDWATDRIIPDLVRATRRDSQLMARDPEAVRPWQHVLDPLSGYLLLAQRLHESDESDEVELQGPFNFGPGPGGDRTVRELIEEATRHCAVSWTLAQDPVAPHETSRLTLATDKARQVLGWAPRWPFEESVRRTIEWYLRWPVSPSPRALTQSQISDFCGTQNAG